MEFKLKTTTSETCTNEHQNTVASKEALRNLKEEHIKERKKNCTTVTHNLFYFIFCHSPNFH